MTAGRERLAGYFGRHYGDRARERPSQSVRLRGELFRDWAGRGKRLLDAGCGSGLLTASYVEGNHVVGIDVDGQALETCRARLGIETVWADFNEILPFEGGAFEVVVAGETLEHLPYPRLFLAEIQRVLGPGGLFLGSVPNAYRLPRRLDVLRGRPFDRDPTHLQHFSARSLRALLGEHFTVEDLVPVRGRWARWAPSLDAHYFAWRCRQR